MNAKHLQKSKLITVQLLVQLQQEILDIIQSHYLSVN